MIFKTYSRFGSGIKALHILLSSRVWNLELPSLMDPDVQAGFP